MTKQNTWKGMPPARCDICGCILVCRGVFVDGKTAFGQWAIMCESCHRDNGNRLGTGNGQKYIATNAPGETSVWVKVEG